MFRTIFLVFIKEKCITYGKYIYDEEFVILESPLLHYFLTYSTAAYRSNRQQQKNIKIS